MGFTVENNDYLWRIDGLRATGARLISSTRAAAGAAAAPGLTGVDWCSAAKPARARAEPPNGRWTFATNAATRFAPSTSSITAARDDVGATPAGRTHLSRNVRKSAQNLSYTF
jgi:hypothetical protein